jgi:hypothetical protein
MTDAHAGWANSNAYRVLASIAIPIQAVALVFVLFSQRWGGAFSIAVFLALSVLFMYVEERLASLVSFIVVGAATLNAFGWAWNWYNQFAPFDEFIHFFTSFAVMSAVADALWLRGMLKGEPGSGSFVVKVALIGLALGILWEIAESLFLNLGWWDTLLDLIVDTAGAALAGVFIGRLLHEEGLRPART